MLKRLFVLLLLVLISFWFVVVVIFVPIADAQGSQPFVETVDPSEVLAGRETMVTVDGSNFVEPFTVTLLLNGKIEHTLDAKLISSSEIQVLVSEDLSAGNYRLHIQFENSSDRFPFTVISPEPTIDNITPIEFWNKQDVELIINGSGLSLSSLTLLNTAELTNTQVVSHTTIKAIVPAGFEEGEYKLRLLFTDGRRIEYENPLIIHQYITPTISSLSPITIYNNAERVLEVIGEGFSDADKVFLDTRELEQSSIISETKLDIVIPEDFDKGEYPFSITFKHGEKITSEQNIQVRGPINPQISAITPTAIINEGNPQTVVVTGTNLRSGEALALYGDTLLRTVASAWVSKKEEIEGIDRLSISIDLGSIRDYEITDDEQYSLKLEFPDDTEISEHITIYRSIVPRDSEERFGLVFIFAGISAVMLVFYVGVIRSTNSFKQNKTAPGTLIVAGLILGFLAIIFISGLLWRIVSTGDYRYITVWVLATSAVALAWLFYHWTGHFHEILPKPIRAIFALFLSVLAIAIPFFFNRPDVIEQVIYVEILLIGFIAVLGISGSILARRRLEEIRAFGPDDSTILFQVEQVLYSKGQASAEDDFPDLPRDRVKKALETYLTRNREKQALDYIGDALRLSFQRQEDVSKFSEAVKDLRQLLETGNEAQRDIEKPSDKLADIIRSQMQCEWGEKFSLPQNASKQLAVYSLENSELASVLPTPFPLIIFRSNNLITSDELQYLKQLQNGLDVPSRFAVLIAISNADASRRAINDNLGGVARENIAVLGEREWADILTSIHDMRLSFMEIIQSQVDLTIFSPYQTLAPTKLDMFFGRTDEIGKVTESISNRSIAVLGARRIGKTSMLQAVQNILKERGRFLLYLDCYHINNYEGFFEEMETRWQEEVPKLRMDDYQEINHFPRFVNDLRTLFPELQIVFQFDEIDRLLAYDSRKNDELLFRMFRSLSQQKKCQFLFSGERTILDKLSDPHSSFFNFATPVQLNLLDKKSSFKLIQEPMALVGVSFEYGNQASEMIFEATSGHPSLLQYVCEALLKNLKDKRIIKLELVKNVLATPSHRNDYLRVLWSQANPLERAMSVVACELGNVKERDFLRRLQEAGFEVTIDQIQRGLRYLELCQLFTNVDGHYTLKPSKFSEFLLAYSLEERLETFRKDWEKWQEDQIIQDDIDITDQGDVS